MDRILDAVSVLSKEETSGGGGSSGGGAGTDMERASLGLRVLECLDRGLACSYTFEDCKKYF